jgi:dodecin
MPSETGSATSPARCELVGCRHPTTYASSNSRRPVRLITASRTDPGTHDLRHPVAVNRAAVDGTYWRLTDMTTRGSDMSVYKVIEIIGTSTESWEDAGLTAVKKARETIRNLRVAEVLEQDLDLDDSGGATFRTKLRVSFKYEDEA